MTTAATFELDPVTVALQGWLQTEIRREGDEYTLTVADSIAPIDDDGQAAPAPYVVLFQMPGVRRAPAPLRGATMLTGRWLATSVGLTPSQARTVADRVRGAFAGTDHAGVHQTAMTLPLVKVIRRACLEDGALDVVQGVPQWSETFELDLVPA